MTDILRPGNIISLDYGEDNRNNATIEIRAVINGHVVYRTWRGSGDWKYEIKRREDFRYLYEHGVLSVLKESRSVAIRTSLKRDNGYESILIADYDS